MTIDRSDMCDTLEVLIAEETQTLRELSACLRDAEARLQVAVALQDENRRRCYLNEIPDDGPVLFQRDVEWDIKLLQEDLDKQRLIAEHSLIGLTAQHKLQQASVNSLQAELDSLSPDVSAKPGPSAPQAQLIIPPPGMDVRRWLSFVYSRKAMTRIVEPILADMQDEWRELHEHNASPLRVRLAMVRGYIHLALALNKRLVVTLVKELIDAWKAA